MPLVRAGTQIAVSIKVVNRTGQSVDIVGGSCSSWIQVGLTGPRMPVFEPKWPQAACQSSKLRPGITMLEAEISTVNDPAGAYSTAVAISAGVQAKVTVGPPVRIRLQD